jgi:chaperone required for assembly of F1-ATPase
LATSPNDSAKQPAAPPRPRFYKTVTVAEEHGRFRVLLDGKTMRTPAKNELAVPTRALADAIAAEWDSQGERIDPATMPLTRLANSILDGVIGREAEVRQDIAKYAESDLVCYRAENPQDLVVRQVRAWNPVLAWAQEALGAGFQVAEGVMPVRQSDAAIAAISNALEPYDAYRLAALHVMTSLMGSVLLALAHAKGRLSAEEAWAAAHIDEDWQVSHWGEDAEAKARRDRRWADMQAASRLIRLLD